MESAVRAALQAVIDPNTGQDFITGKQLKRLAVNGSEVQIDIELGYPAASQLPGLRAVVVAAVSAVPGVSSVSVELASRVIAHAVPRGVQLLPGVKNIIAVASGKGGVGKSTTAANLALALSAEGARVGVLDADIYGPSQPLMLGASGGPESLDGKTMEPKIAHGLQLNSIGFMVDDDQALIWRGRLSKSSMSADCQSRMPNHSHLVEYLFRSNKWCMGSISRAGLAEPSRISIPKTKVPPNSARCKPKRNILVRPISAK
jgi:ATP-binding protein involved in chromosome partitioning